MNDHDHPELIPDWKTDISIHELMLATYKQIGTVSGKVESLADQVRDLSDQNVKRHDRLHGRIDVLEAIGHKREGAERILWLLWSGIWTMFGFAITMLIQNNKASLTWLLHWAGFQ